MKNPIYTVAKKIADPPTPFRNPLCPEYDSCLKKAAIHDLFLDCTECEMKDKQAEIRLNPWEIKDYKGLLNAIFGQWKPG